MKNLEKQNQEIAEPAKSPSEHRQERIEEIDQELERFNYQAKSQAEIQEVQKQREEEYQMQMKKLGDLPVGEESREIIHGKMVGEVIEHARDENEMFIGLNKERRKLILYNNLELGENAEEVIEKARSLILEKDNTGEKIKTFEEALEYFSQPQEKIADIPVFHSTGSWSLAKIIEGGVLQSDQNTLTGEQATTLRGTEIKKYDINYYKEIYEQGEVGYEGTEQFEHPFISNKAKPNSLVIGGYDQSEIVSYYYARKNSREPSLALDSLAITGEEPESTIVKIVFSELPKLKEEERTMILEGINNLKEGRNITDEELKEEKINDLKRRVYYYDKYEISKLIEEKKEELEKTLESNNRQKIKKLENEIVVLQERFTVYEEQTPEMKEELDNSFPTVLTYEGKKLPAEDLDKLLPALISERQTQMPMLNSELRQIRVPKKEILKVRKWILDRIKDLPEDSSEKKSLEKVKIIPLEYFEAKLIINFQR